MKKHFKSFPIIILLSVLLSLFLLSGCSLFGTDDTNQSYDVTNDYFTYLSFKPSTLANADLVNHTTSYEYVITVDSECSVSLYEYTANVKLYSSNNSLLHQDTVTNAKKISAATRFSFYIKVLQSIQLATSRVEVTYSGKSYENPSEAPIKNCTVTLVYNNNLANKTINVQSGDTLSEPTSPAKKNYIFSYWCTDEALTKKYDFSQAVKNDLTLYAKYAVDYAALTNTITATTMKANVTVYTKSYNTFLGFTTTSSTSSGSGIIFTLSYGYYYLITNNHVSVKNSAYDNVSYTIEDYKGNTYTGYLKYEDNKYDLAVLYFKKDIDLAKIDIATKNPSVKDELVSLGQPLSQNNAISYGKCSSYRQVTLDNTPTYQSNVSFNVMQHSCPTDKGSSGGAVLNTDLKLVGIHYAGSHTASGSFVCGYAIPIVKVNEFLNLYIWGK